MIFIQLRLRRKLSIICHGRNSCMPDSAWIVGEHNSMSWLRKSFLLFCYFITFNLHFKLHTQIKRHIFFTRPLSHKIQTIAQIPFQWILPMSETKFGGNAFKEFNRNVLTLGQYLISVVLLYVVYKLSLSHHICLCVTINPTTMPFNAMTSSGSIVMVPL